ncbi:MAG: hypothetical protein OEY56_03865 [Cyclobacteriaceae bacterium]|nr:hypothetical protein [Cyclobacteriaceae bacterium]
MIIDIGLYASYILIALCALAAVLIPLIQSFDNPKSLVKSAIGIGFLLVVFFIGYIMADGSSEVVSESTSKYVGAGLFTTYIFFFAAIIGIVYTEIAKIIK